MNHPCDSFQRTLFEGCHPVVPAAYCVFVLVFCMAAFQPALIVLSLVSGVAFGCYLRGIGAMAKSALWQVVLFLAVAIVNPIVSAQGSTLLFVVGPLPLIKSVFSIYLESVIYGVCMGGMLVAALNWFANAAVIMTSDRVMALSGARAPLIGLMISMVARLVPQFVRRGRLVGDAAAATTAARRPIDGGAGKANALGPFVRQIAVLAGWSLEDSIETADAMRARGWGAARRTTYQRNPFGAMDAALLMVMAAIAIVTVAVTVVAGASASFYPRFSLGTAWWAAAILYAIELCIPAIMEVRAWARWR